MPHNPDVYGTASGSVSAAETVVLRSHLPTESLDTQATAMKHVFLPRRAALAFWNYADQSKPHGQFMEVSLILVRLTTGLDGIANRRPRLQLGVPVVRHAL